MCICSLQHEYFFPKRESEKKTQLFLTNRYAVDPKSADDNVHEMPGTRPHISRRNSREISLIG